MKIVSESRLSGKTYFYTIVPRLIYFEHSIPEPFVGDLNKENEILSWISGELSKDEIKSVSRAVLDRSVIQKCTERGAASYLSQGFEDNILGSSFS